MLFCVESHSELFRFATHCGGMIVNVKVLVGFNIRVVKFSPESELTSETGKEN